MAAAEKEYILTIRQAGDNKAREEGEESPKEGRLSIIKTLAQFQTLSTRLENESLQLPPFPSSPDIPNLTEYFRQVLYTPGVVRTDALASFLVPNSLEADDSSLAHTHLEYIQYLLPEIQQEPAYVPVPRFGSYQHTIDVLLPGWWLVWYVKVAAATTELTVDLVVSIVNGNEVTIVHEEACTTTSQESYYFGSYRISSDQTTTTGALLTVTGRSMFTTESICLQAAAIPHEAFIAACTAAADSNSATQKRQDSPMLSMLYDTADTTIEVEISTRRRKEISAPPAASLATALSEQLASLELQNQKLREERDGCKKDLGTNRSEATDLVEKLRICDSERRVWNVVRDELQAELVRLAQGLESEKKNSSGLAEELEESERELREIRGQAKLLELQSTTNGTIAGTSSAAMSDLNKTVQRLEMELKSERQDRQKLEDIHRQAEKTFEAKVKKAADDLHEARMSQRILAGQVRQLEQDRQRVPRSAESSKPKKKKKTYRELAPHVANFEHSDSRLNEQLTVLRDRHRKLSDILAQNPNNAKNLEILGMIEKAIHDIVKSSAKEES